MVKSNTARSAGSIESKSASRTVLVSQEGLASLIEPIDPATLSRLRHAHAQ